MTLILLCVFTFGIKAQESNENDTKLKNMQFYVEFGGPGVLFSANIDSRFNSQSKLGLGFRAGVGFGLLYEEYDYYDYGYYFSSETTSYATFPVEINYLFGKQSSPHMFEVGVGATILSKKMDLYNYNSDYNPGNVIGHATFMYRRQPLDGGFTWRIGLMPVIGTAGDIALSGGVGFGYSF